MPGAGFWAGVKKGTPTAASLRGGRSLAASVECMLDDEVGTTRSADRSLIGGAGWSQQRWTYPGTSIIKNHCHLTMETHFLRGRPSDLSAAIVEALNRRKRHLGQRYREPTTMFSFGSNSV